MSKYTQVIEPDCVDVENAFQKVEDSRGYVSNVMRTLAHSPQGLLRHMEYGHYLRFGTELTEEQRELVICSTVRTVDYAWTHHSGLLKQLGVTQHQAETLKGGEIPPDFSDINAALCEFVFELTAFKGVTEAVLQKIRSFFSDRQIMDIALLSSYYIASGAIIVAFDVPIEPPDVLDIELQWQSGRPH